MMDRYRFDALTYPEIRERARDGWLAVAPTGCTEQQGPHLPVGFDTWFAGEMMLASASRAEREYGVRALVLPAMPFGPTPEHRGYGSGYIDVPVALHDAVIRAVLESLAQQEFRRLVVWRGCGGHALEGMVAAFNRAWAGRSRAFLPAHPFHQIWRRVGDASVPGGHADSFTTSISLHLYPDLVRTGEIPDRVSDDPDWSDPNLDFSRYSESGVIGDARHASAELGARLWEEVVKSGAAMLRDIAMDETLQDG